MIRTVSAIQVSSFGFAALLSLGMLSSVHAGSITWGAGQPLTGDPDVKNNGTAVDAISIGGANTINSVSFNGVTQSGNLLSDGTISVSFGDSYGNFTAPFTTTPPSSAAYSNLVNTGAFGENSNVGSFNVVTLGGATPLISGDTYQVEAFSYYSGDSATTTTSYTNDSMTADQGVAGTTVFNQTGGFSVGTFTADAATQSFNYFLTNPFGGHNFVNAIVLRDLTTATPEPASFGLLGIGAGMLMKRRRRT